MPSAPSIMSLHLKYRMVIAELNFDINVLRIFGDYLTELRTKRKEPEVKSKSDYFEKEFHGLRTEIDDIRHEMQLVKMKLGAFSRESEPFDYKIFNKEYRSPLRKRLLSYKSKFKKVNKEFEEFEGQWLI
ncbi:MAG TPA: hypothetical protein VFE04_12430 [Puia sp.]|jgi:uncharacterized coiled-coil DUF342 family protein|nr:hypothetical protein [Puia sp.]